MAMEESGKSRMSQSMPKLKLIRFCFHIDFNIFILLIHTQSLQPTLPNVASKSHRQSKAIADLALDFSDSDKKKKTMSRPFGVDASGEESMVFLWTFVVPLCSIAIH